MPEPRKVFHDSVVPIPVESGPAPNGLMVQSAAAENRDERMTVHFSLALPPETEADLEAKWRAVRRCRSASSPDTGQGGKTPTH